MHGPFVCPRRLVDGAIRRCMGAGVARPRTMGGVSENSRIPRLRVWIAVIAAAAALLVGGLITQAATRATPASASLTAASPARSEPFHLGPRGSAPAPQYGAAHYTRVAGTSATPQGRRPSPSPRPAHH
jgi:hypothetical protein